MAEIIGRKAEQAELLRIFNRRQAQLVAVYGRRRVGKTFLVRELLKEHFVFYHTGISPLELEGRNLLDAQLAAFASTLAYSGASVSGRPKDWTEAFQWLRDFLAEQDSQKRMVVFIDEMPWMDAPKSSFLSALEHFWNGFASTRKDVLLIVCGSATSWITRKLLKNKQGLHNRVTCRIHLQPFTLYECECYAQQQRLGMNRFFRV